MVNTLEEGGNELVNLNYSHLLTTILKILQDPQTKSLFSKSNNGKQFFIDIDEIADRVASSSIENPLGSQSSSAKSATFNLNKASQSAFIQQVQQIRECLKQQIEAVIGEGEQQVSIEQYLEQFAQKLSNFTGECKSDLDLEYPFRNPYKGLQKQRLSLNKKTSNASPLLRGHKLTISVNNTHRFQEQLKESLENFIKTEFSSDDEQEELNFILEDLIANPKSEFYNLQRLVDVEALGKLQREAKIRYLEYLEEHIGEHKDIIYLADLIRRLRLLEEYINDEEKEDGHYQVNYQGVSVNYRTIFSRAEAYDDLPIIPIIEGYLGEIKDEERGKQQFIFGIKLKLNGQVQTESGQTAFDYRLDLIDPTSKIHQERITDSHQKNRFAEKVLKIALLYYFIFAGDDPNSEDYDPRQDLDYDPISNFEIKVLPILQGSNDNEKADILGRIKKGLTKYKVASKIQKLKNLLTDTLCRNSSMKTRNYPLHISINRGVLDDDFRKISDRSSFFKEVITANQKQALKYISVEEATADPNALCTLPGSIQINDIQYFTTKDSQTFSMEYDDVSSISTIPVVVSPDDKKCQAIYQGSNLGKYNILGFLYNRDRLLNNHFKNIESPQAFTYKISFALLAYISLQILFESSKKGIFIPILRLHLTGKDNPSPEEEFMRSLFLVLSHLLNEKNRSNSQGFEIGKTSSFKIKNGLSSLYSILPKKFKFDDPVEARKIEKLAIVIVSSRESDRSKKGDYKITNLMGEAIAIQHQEKDNSIRLQSYGTFSGNYGSQDIYSHPDCLLDKFNLLYQHGYRHFLYIAKSPYSSTLNMINTEQDKELFFMSKELVKSVRGNKEDMKIYPVFFDRYSVLKIGKPEIDSLYIQDIAELTEIVKDPSKKSVVFFNLFNGITVPGGERYYNGVMSYSTLLNVYDNILDDKDIHLGLIDDGDLKRDILQYLTLFHFSRYESPGKKVNLKLNPYQNIIGDDSVGANSVFTHMSRGVKFNSLSFLTEVRRALNVQPESEDVEECQS
jgi:hypothetical protein